MIATNALPARVITTGLTGSLKIGLNGLIGFSSRPIQVMSLLGIIFAGISFLLGAWYLAQKTFGL